VATGEHRGAPARDLPFPLAGGELVLVLHGARLGEEPTDVIEIPLQRFLEVAGASELTGQRRSELATGGPGEPIVRDAEERIVVDLPGAVELVEQVLESCSQALEREDGEQWGDGWRPRVSGARCRVTQPTDLPPAADEHGTR
jgi:hypothetical protein